MPGVRARLILGTYSGPGGPASVAAGGGSPVTSEGSWPFRCFGHHVGAGDGGVDGWNRTCMPSFKAHAFWVEIWASSRVSHQHSSVRKY